MCPIPETELSPSLTKKRWNEAKPMLIFGFYPMSFESGCHDEITIACGCHTQTGFACVGGFSAAKQTENWAKARLRRRFSPRKESYRLCPFYQRQLVNEDVIVVDKLPHLGIGFVAIILGPGIPHEGIWCDGVDK
jgi:disulfide oxidoreductase YuzD